jgi:MYXO-CTERM domain-containing protein
VDADAAASEGEAGESWTRRTRRGRVSCAVRHGREPPPPPEKSRALLRPLGLGLVAVIRSAWSEAELGSQ